MYAFKINFETPFSNYSMHVLKKNVAAVRSILYDCKRKTRKPGHNSVKACMTFFV